MDQHAVVANVARADSIGVALQRSILVIETDRS